MCTAYVIYIYVCVPTVINRIILFKPHGAATEPLICIVRAKASRLNGTNRMRTYCAGVACYTRRVRSGNAAEGVWLDRAEGIKRTELNERRRRSRVYLFTLVFRFIYYYFFFFPRVSHPPRGLHVKTNRARRIRIPYTHAAVLLCSHKRYRMRSSSSRIIRDFLHKSYRTNLRRG